MRAFPFEAGSVTRRLIIASTSNERLKAVRRLARKRSREAFVAEGSRAVRCALDAGADVHEIFAAPGLFLGAGDEGLLGRAERRGIRVIEVESDAFLSIAGNVRADGLLAVVGRPATALARLSLPPEPMVLVTEAVERPGNLGTIVRTACAAGADALIACDEGTDVFHPEVVRGSVGTIFQLPVATATSERAIAWLREHGVPIVVATPHARTPYHDADLRGALVVGNERYGLTDVWLDAVAIPLPGPADSLNVAVAAGVVLFEAARRRATPPPPQPLVRDAANASR
jgi:TrmH family RNA methyltransferase